MKKSFSIALGLLLAASFVACDKKGANNEQSASSANPAPAQKSGEWMPKENISVIVAYKAGSGTDNTARVLTQFSNKYTGQTMVIDNLPGGSGSIGWTALAGAKPDGQTIGFVNLPTLCSNIIEGNAQYKMEDFKPIVNHVSETSLVLVSAKSQFNTLKELVEYAKANPKKLKASTNGKKASNHIGAQLLANSAGFDYTAIPYGGTADQLLALRQGEVDFSVAKEADIASMRSDVKVLGIFDKKRAESFPDAPTLGELGYYNEWYGSARAIVAPKGVSDEIVKYYEKAFKGMMEDEGYKEAAKKASVGTAYMSTEETAKLFESQYKFCKEVSSIWK